MSYDYKGPWRLEIKEDVSLFDRKTKVRGEISIFDTSEKLLLNSGGAPYDIAPNETEIWKLMAEGPEMLATIKDLVNAIVEMSPQKLADGVAKALEVVQRIEDQTNE